MNESAVENAFVSWLEQDGWDVRRQVEHLDVLATRSGEELRAEVKGHTSSIGTDVDAVYGQLLRRMGANPHATYAVVGPSSAIPALLRVPAHVRGLLRIRVFEVTATCDVVERG